MTRFLGRRPSLEALEDRWCPAASITAIGGNLTVVGSNLNDVVTVTIDDAKNAITVQASDAFSSTTRVFAASSINHMSIQTAGGNDTVTCKLASDMTRARDIRMFLGEGNDRAFLDFGLHKSHAISADLRLSVYGQGGNDTLQADFGDVNARNLHVLADMGEGNDVAVTALWGILRGTQTSFDLRGGNGNDYLRFYNDNGSWPSARLDVDIDGGAGNDNVSMFYDDNMEGTHDFRIDGGDGNDLVNVEIHARGGSVGSLNLDVEGGDGNDAMRTVLDITPGAPLNVIWAEMDGGPGADTVLAGTTPNVLLINFP
jgi:hypothetical protein